MNDFIIHVNLYYVLNPSAGYLSAHRLTYTVRAISNIYKAVSGEKVLNRKVSLALS